MRGNLYDIFNNDVIDGYKYSKKQTMEYSSTLNTLRDQFTKSFFNDKRYAKHKRADSSQ